MTCFVTSPPTMTPNGAAFCPAQCSLRYFSSCESVTQCTICQDPLCLSCIGNMCIQCISNAGVTSNNICLCLNGYALNTTSNTCQLCDSSCVTCAAPNDPTQCTECIGNLFLVPDLTKVNKQGTCQAQCPTGIISDVNDVCQMDCKPPCKACTQLNNEKLCTACFDESYILGSAPAPCVESCPAGTALSTDFTTCGYCDPTCSTCLKPNDPTSCLSCGKSTPYFFHQLLEYLEVAHKIAQEITHL